MNRPLILALLLASCGMQPQPSDENAVFTDSGEFANASEVEEYLYYPQPDPDERVFRVKDQFGCDFWLNAGHKFDHAFPVLGDDGKPLCPPGVTVAPTVGYRDKTTKD